MEASPNAPVSGDVGQWINQAFAILQQQGYSGSQLNASAVQNIIQRESGGNPTAVNHSDSNAAAGHPSMGLMQIIQPTFNSYALPGHTDIYDPVDNIIAGVRYATATYGSLSKVPNSGY